MRYKRFVIKDEQGQVELELRRWKREKAVGKECSAEVRQRKGLLSNEVR